MPHKWFPGDFDSENSNAAAAVLRRREASGTQVKMEWFVRRGTVVDGPLTEGQLGKMLLSGDLSGESEVAPNRHDFRRVTEWEAWAPLATRNVDNSPGTRIFGEDSRYSDQRQRSTVVLGTSAPLAASDPKARGERGTALLGSEPDVSILAEEGAHWPGPTQHDPDERANDERDPAPPRRDAPRGSERLESERLELERPVEMDDGQTFFDSVPRSPPVAPPSPARVPAFVPAPRVIPLADQSKTVGQIAALSTALLALCVASAGLLDRVLNGPATSDISQYLPAGSPLYFEVPSVRRWSRGLNEIEFVASGGFEPDAFLTSLSDKFDERGPESAFRKRLLAQIESFAVTTVEGQWLYAVRYARDAGLTKHLTERAETPKQTEWGPRYRTKGKSECIWMSDSLVEVCGTAQALENSLQVLRSRAPSAEEDAYLNAAKKRTFWSYLPFAEVPAAYAVGNHALFEKTSGLQGLAGATATAHLDKKGYREKLDLLFAQGKTPQALAESAPLTLFRSLPEGTLFYANFRVNFAKTSEEFDAQIASFVELPPGAPSLDSLTERAKDILGFHPVELAKGLAAEGLVAVTLPPEARLLPSGGEAFPGAFWFVQTIDDHAEVRRTLNALVERLSEESSALFWKDEHNLIGRAPSGANLHLRIEKSNLRLGIGSARELARVFGQPNLLEADHLSDTLPLDEEMSALAWLDLGRLLREPDVDGRFPLAERRALENLKQALTLTGAARPVAALSLRRFQTGEIRVRSLNFPTSLVLFTLGTLGSSAPP